MLITQFRAVPRFPLFTQLLSGKSSAVNPITLRTIVLIRGQANLSFFWSVCMWHLSACYRPLVAISNTTCARAAVQPWYWRAAGSSFQWSSQLLNCTKITGLISQVYQVFQIFSHWWRRAGEPQASRFSGSGKVTIWALCSVGQCSPAALQRNNGTWDR